MLLLMLLLLHRGRSLLLLRLLIQTLAPLAGVGLVRAPHAAVVIERVEAASGC